MKQNLANEWLRINHSDMYIRMSDPGNIIKQQYNFICQKLQCINFGKKYQEDGLSAIVCTLFIWLFHAVGNV